MSGCSLSTAKSRLGIHGLAKLSEKPCALALVFFGPGDLGVEGLALGAEKGKDLVRCGKVRLAPIDKALVSGRSLHEKASQLIPGGWQDSPGL